MSEDLRIHEETLLESIFYERDILEEVLRAFCDDVCRVTREVREAEAEKDFEKGAGALHALKGVFGSVAAFSEAREAEFLEKKLEARTPGFWDRGCRLLEAIPEVQRELEVLLDRMDAEE
ncbi:MAG TPA: hypothetical protein PK364_10600 [Synergistaceae bacterium]|nr:hypothetical protein [Synergistaceae bacterium]HPJ26011.1 hypothetical protein [Synergistaceae bacterium]HPQ36440.1 hypothetical protein [Synergistaceae bacterium]